MMGSDINHNDSGLHADSDGIHAAFDFRVKSEIRITSLLTSEFKLEVGKKSRMDSRSSFVRVKLASYNNCA